MDAVLLLLWVLTVWMIVGGAFLAPRGLADLGLLIRRELRGRIRDSGGASRLERKQ